MSDHEPASQYETVNVYRRGAAAKLELNRPERMNAWNTQLRFDLPPPQHLIFGQPDFAYVPAIKWDKPRRIFGRSACKVLLH